MDRIQELMLQIEELKARLRKLMESEGDQEEIYELSHKLDVLIVEYHKLTNKNQ